MNELEKEIGKMVRDSYPKCPDCKRIVGKKFFVLDDGNGLAWYHEKCAIKLGLLEVINDK